MPDLVYTIDFSTKGGLTALASDVDANFRDIETLLDTTKLDSTNIQNLAITTALLAGGSVTLAKMAANSVDASKIVDDSVGEAEIDDTLASGSAPITAPMIRDDAVITRTILDNNVTVAKLETAINSGLINFTEEAENALKSGPTITVPADAAPDGLLVWWSARISFGSDRAITSILELDGGNHSNLVFTMKGSTIGGTDDQTASTFEFIPNTAYTPSTATTLQPVITDGTLTDGNVVFHRILAMSVVSP